MFNHMCVFKCFDWDTNALYVTYMHYLFVLFVTVTQDISWNWDDAKESHWCFKLLYWNGDRLIYKGSLTGSYFVNQRKTHPNNPEKDFKWPIRGAVSRADDASQSAVKFSYVTTDGGYNQRHGNAICLTLKGR